MSNPNKTFHCNAKSITIYYTDSKKHFISSYHSEKINNLQIHGHSHCSKDYQNHQTIHQIENELLTPYQNKLYREAMHGLSIYTGQEIEAMSFKEKLRIENIHKKAQRILNEWKQTIVSQQVDQLLLALFPKSPFLKKIVEKTKDYTTNTIKNHHSFSELNITKTDIIKKLIEKKIIPEISNNLKTAV